MEGLLEALTTIQEGSCWACCSGDVTVELRLLEEADYRDRASWVLSCSMVCTFQQKLLSCPAGPCERFWAGEKHQPALSGAVRNTLVSKTVLAPPKFSSSEDREAESCWSPSIARHEVCSSASLPSS